MHFNKDTSKVGTYSSRGSWAVIFTIFTPYIKTNPQYQRFFDIRYHITLKRSQMNRDQQLVGDSSS